MRSLRRRSCWRTSKGMKGEKTMETWVHRYCYRDKSGQVVVVSKTVKRPRWPGRPRHKGRGKVYGQARG